MKSILQTPDPVLRQAAQPVALETIASPATKKLLAEMSKALAAAEDGLAIAAPQIGESLRIFVVSGKLFAEEGKTPPPDLVFINPEITKLSRKKRALEEGCLSVRNFYGTTRRAERASVTAYNERGEKFTHHGSGLLAQIFQHEVDHLNGILFIDHATDVHEIKPDKH